MDRISGKSAITTYLYTLLFNTIIAVFLTVIQIGKGFIVNLIFSQCIGFSICSCVLLCYRFFQPKRPAVYAILVAPALFIGTIVGSFIGSVASGLNPTILFDRQGFFGQILLLGVLFGSIITYFFSSRERIAASEARAQEEKIKRLTGEKQVAEANLKMLQAQIEPHFLFNTLSNVVSLLDSDPPKAKSMLADFVQYLRASLSKMRGEATTLGQEMDLICAYLNINKIRMGGRLRYQIEIPTAMSDLPFPPMLIQPLVENAIKHGLEPMVEGGEISICGEEKDGVLRLAVVDSGRGFTREPDIGMGLANIRERLQSLYGSGARLIIEENQPHGVKAAIEVPRGKP
jgi:sensor histidine kinase YesM